MRAHRNTLAATTFVVLGLAVIVATGIHQRSAILAQDVVPITTLSHPISSYAIPVEAGLRIQAVTTNGSNLYYLLRGPGHSSLLATDAMGAVKIVFPVGASVSSPVTHLCASADGRVALLHRAGEVELYSATGVAHITPSLGSGDNACTFVDDLLLVRIHDQIITLEGATVVNARERSFRWPTLAFATSGHRLAIIELADAILNLMDTQSGQWQRHSLNSPDMLPAPSPSGADTIAGPPIIDAAPSQSTGDIFALMNGVSVRLGPKVARFDTEGILRARLQCRVPLLESLRFGDNQDGHVLIGHIAVIDKLLILLSTVQQRAFVFSLS